MDILRPDLTILLRALLFSFVSIGIAIALMVIAMKGSKKTGESGWTFLLIAQVISLAMTVIGMIPSIFASMGSYEIYNRFGMVFTGFSFLGTAATGVLTIVAMSMILKAAVPKPPREY